MDEEPSKEKCLAFMAVVLAELHNYLLTAWDVSEEQAGGTIQQGFRALKILSGSTDEEINNAIEEATKLLDALDG